MIPDDDMVIIDGTSVPGLANKISKFACGRNVIPISARVVAGMIHTSGINEVRRTIRSSSAKQKKTRYVMD